MQKKISTLVGVIIIIIVAVILFGGIFAWQYLNKYPFATGPLIENDQQNQNQTQNLEINNSTENKITDWRTYSNSEYNFEIRLPIVKVFETLPETRDFYKDSSYKEIYIATLQAGCDLYVYPKIDDNFLSIIKTTKTNQLLIEENSGQKYYIGYRVASSAVSVEECLPVLNQIISTFKFTK